LLQGETNIQIATQGKKHDDCKLRIFAPMPVIFGSVYSIIVLATFYKLQAAQPYAHANLQIKIATVKL
jgi:hypothetical protein